MFTMSVGLLVMSRLGSYDASSVMANIMLSNLNFVCPKALRTRCQHMLSSAASVAGESGNRSRYGASRGQYEHPESMHK
jgi:hypothetical protein